MNHSQEFLISLLKQNLFLQCIYMTSDLLRCLLKAPLEETNRGYISKVTIVETTEDIE